MGPIKKIKRLVIDSGAFLRNVSIWDYGEEFFSVSDVVCEIRDKQAKDFINSLPVSLSLREPSPTSIKFMNEFTKKIGESTLSVADIKVLALTYELEVEAKGRSDHLRNEPVQRKPVSVTSRPPGLNQVEGFYAPASHQGSNNQGDGNVEQEGKAEQEMNVEQDGNAEQKMSVEQEGNTGQEGNADQEENTEEGNADQEKNAKQEGNADQEKNAKQEGNADQEKNAKQEGNADQKKNAKQEENVEKEIIYIYDIYILDYILADNFFLNGNKIGSKDFNLFSRLLSRYNHLKNAKRLFCKLKTESEMDFFERLCIHHKTVISNIITRPKSCGHPKECLDSSNCHSSPENCAHPKCCKSACMNNLQCAHRQIKGPTNLIPDMGEAEFSNYCDYGNHTDISWEFLKAASRFDYFCGSKIYFKIWFFKVLRNFKSRGFHIDDKRFQEDEKLIKNTLKELRQLDDDKIEEESKTCMFENFADSKDATNVSSASNVPSVTEATEAVSSLDISAASNVPSVAEIGEAVTSLDISQQSSSSNDIETTEGEDGNDDNDDDGDYDDNSDDGDNDDNGDDGDDDEGWITPSNIKSIKGRNNAMCEDDYKDIEVACITSDFAVQNTLLHIGLSTIGVDGKLIKSLRMYTLRCFVCQTLCSDVQKLFCKKCGYKTLKRVSYTLNPDGTKYIWVSNRPINKRGMKYTLPAPRGGKHAINPILCEDQRVPQMRPSKRFLERNNPLHEDFASREHLPFLLKNTNTKSGDYSSKLGNICGFSNEASKHRGTFYWEKKNPNAPGKNVRSRKKS